MTDGPSVPEPTLAARLQAERATYESNRLASPIQRVQIVDVSIPFGSMVGLLLTIAIAAIPAALILVVLGVLIVAVVGGLGTLPR